MAVTLLTPTTLRLSTLSTVNGKEGKNKLSKPSFLPAKERVVERSKDRVSKLCERY